MDKSKFWVIVTILVVMTVVILQNTAPVRLRILVAVIEMPLAVMSLMTLLVGGAAGYLLGKRRTLARIAKAEAKALAKAKDVKGAKPA